MLPVREMVLYKHGVGFFVRQGAFEGEEIALTFRRDEINDVLKSLAVFDQAGGQIRGMYYQTPMDRDARLAASSIQLSAGRSLGDLLRDLRGRRAELTFERIADKLESISGLVIGLDEPESYDHEAAPPLNVALMADNGQIYSFPFHTLRSLKIEDDLALHDLHYVLETAVGETDRRTVQVRMDAGAHDLVVYYVAPSPTWRVSYRLVAHTSADQPDQGRALLQGWGLFDNRLEEDLNQVRVTLVAGQPISFIYDLYESRIPHRPTVKDEARVAPGPVEFDIEYERGITLDDDSAPGMRFAGGSDARARKLSSLAVAAPAPRMEMAAMAQSAIPATETKATGETFQYSVTTPVTVKRGESALVPILGSEITCERELLYNGSKLALHPVAALRFHNASGLTLERGPVTVVIDGDYRGEAVIPFTREEGQVYVPYAVEQGIRIAEQQHTTQQVVRLHLELAYVLYEEYRYENTRYTLENTTGQAQTVTLEAPALNEFGPDAAYFETRPPDAETLTTHRWRVPLPPRSKTEFVVQRRRLTFRKEEVRRLSYQRLSEALAHGWLDDALHTTLKELLDTLAEVERLNQQLVGWQEEIKTLHTQQEQHRANLSALQPTGDEAPLRARVLRQLEATQDRLEQIDGEIQQARAKIDVAGGRLRELSGLDLPPVSRPATPPARPTPPKRPA
ncbi:MAG: hypothetical protein MUE40_00920 [Anaerolineae bacterium]|nr:hypothetical protein [Anaerolineae bacterium]